MSPAGHDPLWSAQQRAWLQALGHELLVVAPAPEAEAPALAAPADAYRSGARPSAGTAPAAPRTAAPMADSLLLQALARAAGRAPHDPDFLRALPNLAVLRGNPAARRALWPQLRALRRRGAG